MENTVPTERHKIKKKLHAKTFQKKVTNVSQSLPTNCFVTKSSCAIVS